MQREKLVQLQRKKELPQALLCSLKVLWLLVLVPQEALTRAQPLGLSEILDP